MGKIKHFLILLLICIKPSISFSQDKSHIVTIYSGISNYIERDDAMSPFKYKGISIPINLSYRYTGAKCRQNFYADFDRLKLFSSIPDYEEAGLNHYVKNTNIQMGYSYLHRVFRLVKSQTELYLGGEINSLINLRQHAYIHNNEFLMLDQFNSLGIKAQLEKKFKNNSRFASLSINIPILSYALMGNTYNAYVGQKIDPLMNYSGNMLFYLVKKGDIISLNKLFYFKTDFSFIQFVSSHIGFDLKYSLRFYKFCQYQNLNYSRNLQGQFLIGIICKL